MNSAKIAAACLAAGIPWLLEQPWPVVGYPSMVNFHEWQAISARQGVLSTKLMQ